MTTAETMTTTETMTTAETMATTETMTTEETMTTTETMMAAESMTATEAVAANAERSTLPYIVFAVGRNVCSINSEHVRGIETLDEFNEVVDSDPNVRGMVSYQNTFIPLIDTRKAFGLSSQIEEFENQVHPEQRIRDHENWVNTLERSVRDNVEFTLTDDPHKCAFGKWYYSFKTDNNALKHQLSAIERPHETIHNTAKVVKKLMRDGDPEAALEAIKEMKETHYKTTLHILSSLREIVSNSLKELYIVIDSGEGLKGLIVDAVMGIEDLDLYPVPESLSNSRHIKFLGRSKKDNSIIQVFDNLF